MTHHVRLRCISARHAPIGTLYLTVSDFTRVHRLQLDQGPDGRWYDGETAVLEPVLVARPS
mgnify:FL=1